MNGEEHENGLRIILQRHKAAKDRIAELERENRELTEQVANLAVEASDNARGLAKLVGALRLIQQSGFIGEGCPICHNMIRWGFAHEDDCPIGQALAFSTELEGEK